MPVKKPFYITTTLPYVNAEAHLGHALEFVRADAVARTKHMLGHEVLFNTGTDEHGVKIYQKAQETGVPTQQFVDAYAEKFKQLHKLLGLKADAPSEGFTSHFIRTTDPHHVAAATEFWKICSANGYIYKKAYKGFYCVSDEAFVTEKDMVNGFCPNHPGVPLLEVEEENYFFKFSAFSDKLAALYAPRADFVVPSSRFNEAKNLITQGLEDFSISRIASRMPWGIPVPGDNVHVMYVWFDALVDYISTIGWPEDTASFDKWWKETGGVVQYCGKDNLQHQALRWQAMLMSVGLTSSRQIVVNGFVTGEGGVKMSKSLGNVVSPVDLVNEYGTDAVRYYVLRELSMFEDSPFSNELFKAAYNTGLANGIGNLVSRVMRMATTNGVELAAGDAPTELDEKIVGYVERYEHNKAMDEIWTSAGELDRFIQEKEPFKLIKTDPVRAKEDIAHLLAGLAWIAFNLRPFLPETAAKIQECLDTKAMPSAPLFQRKD